MKPFVTQGRLVKMKPSFGLAEVPGIEGLVYVPKSRCFFLLRRRDQELWVSSRPHTPPAIKGDVHPLIYLRVVKGDRGPVAEWWGHAIIASPSAPRSNSKSPAHKKPAPRAGKRLSRRAHRRGGR